MFEALVVKIKAFKALTEFNDTFIVESIRYLAEFLCFSEQFGLDYFQLFIAHDILTLDLPRFLKMNHRLINF